MRITNIGQLVVGTASPTTSRATGTTITPVTSAFHVTQIPSTSKSTRVFPNNYLGDACKALMSPGYEVTEFPKVIMDGRNEASLI